MDIKSFPTKGNLMAAKNSLALANMGYLLMDKKRNILIRELMSLIDAAQEVQNEIDAVFSSAYEALQNANINIGIDKVQNLAYTIPIDMSIRIKLRSIMGTEIPIVSEEISNKNYPHYTFYSTTESIDKARVRFKKVKQLIIQLSTIETGAYRLAVSIKKTQKRANALQNITIPYYTEFVKNISNALEEKEREEFSRLKIIKSQKENG